MAAWARLVRYGPDARADELRGSARLESEVQPRALVQHGGPRAGAACAQHDAAAPDSCAVPIAGNERAAQLSEHRRAVDRFGHADEFEGRRPGPPDCWIRRVSVRLRDTNEDQSHSAGVS